MTSADIKFAVLLMGGASLWGQSDVGRPLVGQMIDQQRSLRPVYGVSGSFTVGASLAERVFASACSLTLCLAKTEDALMSLSGSTPAPPGGAMIAPDATGATVYFPHIRQFERWQNGTLTGLNLHVEGTVLSIASSPAGLSIAVERSGVIWIVASDGSLLGSLPLEATAVLLLPGMTIYATADSVVLRRSDGSEQRFPAPGVTSLVAMGDGYVEASAGGVLYALRTVAGREHLFQLPQAEAVQTQIELTLENGSQKTPLTPGSTYSLGQIAAGASFSFVIQVVNNGSAPVSCNPALSGTGFSMNSPCANSQSSIAPGGTLNVNITFAGSAAASYSTSFQFGTTGPIFFVITVAPAATLTVAAPCTGPDSNLTVSFGNVAVGQMVVCSMQLLNQSMQTVTVSTMKVAGTGFLLSQPPATPLTLPPGASSSFTVTLALNSAMVYSGVFTIDSQTFSLTGTAFNAPLPTPMLQFDTNVPQSGQQITLSMALPEPAAATVAGSINMAFLPDPSVAAVVSDDPAVNFVTTGARSVPFSIQAGSTLATLGGQSGAVFATGTTAGKITFTVATGTQLSGDPTRSITLAPIPVLIDNAAATAIAGALNVQVWGFDNTYSAGPMSFTFQDNSGNAIGAGAIAADFSSSFKSYFTGSTDGGAFAMLVSFPITGNAAAVGSVNVKMTNSAGTASITNLVFLNDTGTCVLIGNVLACPGAPTQ
jgi:hypothetical protein